MELQIKERWGMNKVRNQERKVEQEEGETKKRKKNQRNREKTNETQ